MDDFTFYFKLFQAIAWSGIAVFACVLAYKVRKL